MTQLEALKADYRTLTEAQKLFVLVEDIDTVADRMSMIKDFNIENNSIITEKMISDVRRLAEQLYNIAYEAENSTH